MHPKLENSKDTYSGNSLRIEQVLRELFSADSHDKLFQSLCSLGCEASGAEGVAILSRLNGEVKAVMTSFPAPERGGETSDWLAELAKCYGQTLAEGVQFVPLSSASNAGCCVFIHLFSNAQEAFSLAAYIAPDSFVSPQSVADCLQLVRASLFLVENSPQPASEVDLESQLTGASNDSSLLPIIDVVSEVQSCTRFFEACTTCCAQLVSKFACRRVALGKVEKSKVKLVSLDQMDSFARGTKSVRLLEETMLECLDQQIPLHYSKEKGKSSGGGVILRAARELADNTGAESVTAIPWQVGGQVAYVMVLITDSATFAPSQFDSLHLICRLLAPRFKDLQQAEEFPAKKVWRYLVMRSADVFGPRHTVLKLGASVFAVFLFLTMIISAQITVSAPTAIEGIHSYTHTSPIDSSLVYVKARPGDRVKKGDVLGRLDSTDITMEIAALEAQKNIYRNQSNQYIQEGKTAEANVALLEAKKAEAELAWAHERLGMTELVSNVDGFIISEDMYPRLGQPVRRGQELFEITDTASLRVIVHVAEEDIRDIHDAMARGDVAGQFTLTAYPDLHISFTIERIHPYASVTDKGNGFEVRGRLKSVPEGIVLRPGMEGYARIVAGETSILSLWTRKLVNRIRLFWWKLF